MARTCINGGISVSECVAVLKTVRQTDRQTDRENKRIDVVSEEKGEEERPIFWNHRL